MGNTLISAILVMLVVTVLLAILLVWIKNALMPSGSVKVSINNGSKELEVTPGGDLMHTLADHGIFLPSACGGKANCGQCKLQVLDGGGTILPTETGFFSRKQIKEGWRLGCQVKVKDNLQIAVPESALSVKKLECEVISNENVATFIKEFTVRLPEGEHIDFKSGEYIQIDIPEYEADFSDMGVAPIYMGDWEKYGITSLKFKNTEPTIRAYSMASYPAEKDVIKLNVRIATPPFDLIPLIVPVDVPLWMLALAVAFSVIFVKEVFGGTGMNIWNPALVARAFLFFSYPSSMSGSSVWVSKTWVSALKDVDAVSAATPLAIAHDGGLAALDAQYSFMDMFNGFIPGSTGETSVIAILLGAILLVWTGVASWKIMVSSVAGGLFVGWLAQAAGATDIPCYYQLVMGGFLFGSVFMATDPVTAAQTETGKWIYGFLIGALAVVVRLWNPGYMEGMMLAILFMNTMAPLIDHCVVTAHINRRMKKVKTA